MGISSEKLIIRPLHADEVRCRVNQVGEKGFSLLLYKDARVDMAMLDELFGPMNWKRKHEQIGGKEFCTVSVRNDITKEWVEKQDCGTESNQSKEKGESSDAFKRACTNWGIGRELYTAPFIWISGGTKPDGGKDRKGRPTYGLINRSAKYEVETIETDPNAMIIKKLVIICKNEKVFVWPREPGDYSSPPTSSDQSTVPAKMCEDCGKPIRGVKYNEKDFSTEAIITSARKTYRKQLCWDCCMKRKAAQDAGAD